MIIVFLDVFFCWCGNKRGGGGKRGYKYKNVFQKMRRSENQHKKVRCTLAKQVTAHGQIMHYSAWAARVVYGGLSAGVLGEARVVLCHLFSVETPPS